MMNCSGCYTSPGWRRRSKRARAFLTVGLIRHGVGVLTGSPPLFIRNVRHLPGLVRLPPGLALIAILLCPGGLGRLIGLAAAARTRISVSGSPPLFAASERR